MYNLCHIMNIMCYRINSLFYFVSVHAAPPGSFFDYSLCCLPWKLKWLLPNHSAFRFTEELATIFIASLLKRTLQTPSHAL